jgi:hypothetical protein
MSALAETVKKTGQLGNETICVSMSSGASAFNCLSVAHKLGVTVLHHPPGRLNRVRRGRRGRQARMLVRSARESDNFPRSAGGYPCQGRAVQSPRSVNSANESIRSLRRSSSLSAFCGLSTAMASQVAIRSSSALARKADAELADHAPGDPRRIGPRSSSTMGPNCLKATSIPPARGLL